ncbi:hypothetical protein [Chamaesiphon sp. VAR_69_metabat_338]|uniref:hypothetical protein n=1 Tax=Chamaesiphon sp. VAR_69_metabat_338 TaxID=2964704 RepID=UPI00286D72B7|nr:hypothetical protein [Chamaesiphon sp. VAR_69_metabat_338]
MSLLIPFWSNGAEVLGMTSTICVRADRRVQNLEGRDRLSFLTCYGEIYHNIREAF